MSNHFSQPKNKSVSQHSFAMIPRSDVPRSVFNRDHTHKTSFNAGRLIPMYLDEILPGDSVNIDMATFTRFSPNALLFPMMDNVHMDAFFFFVPTRLLWTNFQRFMGERTPNTDSSTDFLVPVTSPIAGGVPIGSIGDYFGLPTVETQVSGSIEPVSLPGRALRVIWNEWFRDENLQNSLSQGWTADGPDTATLYTLEPPRRGKRHDYFTAALPFAQKGNPVLIPFGTQAPVMTSSSRMVTGTQEPMTVSYVSGTAPSTANFMSHSAAAEMASSGDADPSSLGLLYPTNLYADLSQATAAHINTLRQAAAMQQYLEKDARGGTRYTEKIFTHFGVQSPDARLQRPEYIGGGTSRVTVNAVAQTSETSETPLGQLSGVGTGVGHFRANYSATEHGYIIGLVSVRADLTYQQGLNKLFSRRTNPEYYWPTFAHLGEQAVLRKEIYCTGTSDDELVFGYQPRYDEYRYKPSMVTGRFRSNITGTLDPWHLSQYFSSPPVLGSTFIEENPPMARILAGGNQSTTYHQQFLCDAAFRVRHVRPMPMYSVPGLTRF